MKKLLVFLLLLGTSSAFAQDKYLTRNGEIKIESNAEVDDDVRAVNNQVAVIYVPAKNALAFQVLIKGFEFKKALMQEHFNENYMESSKFPKARFEGEIKNADAIDWSDGKTHEVTVVGQMEIHGVRQNFTRSATMKMVGENVVIDTKFLITIKDFGIEIPELVADKVSKQFDVTVHAELSPNK